jgi:serine/threonine protein kinase/Tol biopolymer transport system component
MALAEGDHLGRYEVLAPLGAGGMGEVYRARDTALDREVAVKVLPEGVAHDPNRLERFEREARAVAKFAHPNILEIWDFGVADGVSYAVTELLEGETLRERLSTGPLEWQEAAGVGAAIADGLAAAHRAGIVHRDLKPSNVFLTSDGRVKILDFGLARMQPPSGGRDETGVPESTLTDRGAAVGTVGYMSPEQVRGEPADHRSDIFSLGCVLYEAASGRRAFERETAAETMTAILKDEPADIWGAGVAVPPELERTIRRCLDKRPDSRYQSAADLAHTLRDLSATAVPVVSRPARWRRAALWIVGAAVVIVGSALALSGLLQRSATEPKPVRRYSINLPADAPLQPSSFVDPQPPLALSPDGEWLVYVARTGTSTRLMRRRLDGLEVEPIEWAEGGVSAPFFSPDGRWVGFSRYGGGPEKILLTGEYPPRVLRDPDDVAAFSGAAWLDDGSILFGSLCPPGIYRISEDGGDTELVIGLDQEDPASGVTVRSLTFPEPLPGGDGILVAKYGDHPQLGRILKPVSLSGREARGALRAVPYGRYARSGHVVFPQGTTLSAWALDVETLAFAGHPVDVSEPGMGVEDHEPHEWAFSQDGTLVYAPITAAQIPKRSLVLVDRHGGEERLDFPPIPDFDWARLSPDGRLVAASVMDHRFHWNVWVHDLETGAQSQVTFAIHDTHPVWSPDGERVVFTSTRDGCAGELYWKQADLGGAAERLTENRPGYFPVPYSWSPDGTNLFFWDWGPGTVSGNLWALDFEETPPRVKLVHEGDGNMWHPAISPDGRWMAYVRGGIVFVSPYPAMDRFWQVSPGAGGNPMWHPKGGSILYLDPNGMLMEAEVRTDQAFSTGSPQVVLEGPYESFDVHPYGEGFLAVKVDPGEPITELVVVENWFEELKRKVPIRN